MESSDVFYALLDNKNKFEILRDLTLEEVEFLKETVSRVDEKFLYKFQYHGIYHSQKVFLFGYLINRKLGIVNEDKKVLYDALLLHDCGRIDEFEESFHGLIGANRLKDYFNSDEYYLQEPNLDLLCSIVDAHSTDDKIAEVIACNYSLDDYMDRFLSLSKILKDADALDRTRFPKMSTAAIKDKYLRFEYSKELIELAYRINEFYVNYISHYYFSMYREEFLDSEKRCDCMHSIGWDFSKLEGILEYGILSDYAASKKDISLSKNFRGNNSNMWISVVDGVSVSKKGDCFKKFLMNGICFYALTTRLFEGEPSKAKAMSMCLPRKSGEYDDESFAFYEIEVEDIVSIVCPKYSFGSKLCDLNYLKSNTNSYSVIQSIVYNHADYISRTTNTFIDMNSANQKLKELYYLQVSFNNETEYYQRANLSKYLKQVESIISSLNDLIRNWMDNSFRQFFGLNKDEHPTVEMMIKYILDKKNIDYFISNGMSIEDGTTILLKHRPPKVKIIEQDI